ncbi:MAG TPA: SusD/RagB family nutrient-binding outer membrane lipoprotein [Chitinophagaceae bacterium]|nr:SusD/RagB family nutrient-binding outer membrane lipoprotein [Chitinophagaceae bacterium]
MKTRSIIKSIFVVTALVFASACTKDFKSINVNPNSPTVVPATNVLVRGILSSASTLFSERLDIFYAGSYAGHTAAIGLGDYEYRVDINNNMWRGMYIAMNYLVNAGDLAKASGNTNLYAAALTLKAYDGQLTTDMWGSVPYSEAFHLTDEGKLYPHYDDQQTVYTKVLAELKEAADIFKSGGTGDLGVGDVIFKGDVSKWRKFCNSVRLRVAIRMSLKDPVTAKNVITEILGDPTGYPIMQTNADNAYLWFPGVSPDMEYWYQRLGTTGAYTDQYRMNDYLITALKTNDDPRLPVYARLSNNGAYNGYKFGTDQLTNPDNNGNNVSGIGARFANDPKGFSPFMNCAEVKFILAEAYERNLYSGDAKTAYENAITLSCSENGIASGDITTFMMQPEVAWNSGTSTNLHKIYLQKWISLFKQSENAWSEARRTDVPLMTNVSKDYANNHNRPPFRMAYADEEKTLNPNFPFNIVETDIFYGTQVWWDTRTGVH